VTLLRYDFHINGSRIALRGQRTLSWTTTMKGGGWFLISAQCCFSFRGSCRVGLGARKGKAARLKFEPNAKSVPEGPPDRSPTPQGLRRDRTLGSSQITGVEARRSLRRRPGTQCLGRCISTRNTCKRAKRGRFAYAPYGPLAFLGHARATKAKRPWRHAFHFCLLPFLTVSWSSGNATSAPSHSIQPFRHQTES
jgi:hypothetical protein